jgi:transcriptional regulator with XRE-family HTH domain
MRGLSQEELAEAIQSKGSYIGRLERGEQNVQLQTLVKISEALHISVFALFDSNPFGHLHNKEWIWRVVHLLQEQSLVDQERAYRVLKEMFAVPITSNDDERESIPGMS